MALQIYKNSSEISRNGATPEEFTQSNANSMSLEQEVDSKKNRPVIMQPQANEKKNLQALLQLSTSLQTTEERTSSTDGPIGQVDEEKELFLKGVLKSLSRDVVGHIKNLIGTIIQFKTKHDDEEECESTLEEILDNVCCIDIAKCFYQLGGLKVITPLLKHQKSQVRGLTASIISECCQNNPFCQDLTVGDDVFSSLMDVANNDEDHTTRFHAFSAISAIVRDNPEGLLQFKKYNGFTVLKDALKLLNTRITAKVSFFITYLSKINGSTKNDLVEADILEALIEAVTTTNDTFPVQALLSLMTNNPYATKQACQNYSGLRDYITSTLNENDQSEADRELVECCSKIAQLMDERAARLSK